jgi:hypothetical protein
MRYRPVNPKDIKTLRQGFKNACMHIDNAAELHEFDSASRTHPLKGIRRYLEGERAEAAESMRKKFTEELLTHINNRKLRRGKDTEAAVYAAIEKAALQNWANGIEIREMRDFVGDVLKKKKQEKGT